VKGRSRKRDGATLVLFLNAGPPPAGEAVGFEDGALAPVRMGR